MAILCEKENGRREGEKESKKLIEFHHGLSVYPSSVYTRGCFHGVWRRRGRVKGVSVLAKYEHIDGKGRNSRARICVCVYVCILESSRRHTYAGHFRCDGVINGN